MSKFLQYSATEDVLQAAVRRIRNVYDTFDTVAVSFSGGKDSLVTLHLARMVAAEYGITRIPVIVRDEEILPDIIIDFLDTYRKEPWVDMRWYAVPQAASRQVLGTIMPYVQWDPSREWVRPKPPWAITLPEGDTRVFTPSSLTAYAAESLPGKVCLLTGGRTAESFQRLMGVLTKSNLPHVCASGKGSSRLMMGRPIYDWLEADVFKFLFDQGVEYCGIYDKQLLSKRKNRSGSLRVGTSIGAEPAKNLDTLRAIDPVFYDRLLRLFPGTDVMERYWSEYDRDGELKLYGADFDGVEAWVRANTHANYLATALAVFANAKLSAQTKPAFFKPTYVLTELMRGAWKLGRILPDPTA